MTQSAYNAGGWRGIGNAQAWQVAIYAEFLAWDPLARNSIPPQRPFLRLARRREHCEGRMYPVRPAETSDSNGREAEAYSHAVTTEDVQTERFLNHALVGAEYSLDALGQDDASLVVEALETANDNAAVLSDHQDLVCVTEETLDQDHYAAFTQGNRLTRDEGRKTRHVLRR